MTHYRLPVMVRETGNYGVPGLIDLSGRHSIGLGGEDGDTVGLFLLLRHKNGRLPDMTELVNLLKETGDYGLPGLVDTTGAATLGLGCNNTRQLNFEFLVVLNGE